MHNTFGKISISEFLVMQAMDGFPIALKMADIIKNIVNSTTEIYKILQLSGFYEVVGYTGEYNSCGDRVRKLDKIADEIIRDEFATNHSIAAVASEECEGIVSFIEHSQSAEYVVMYDPVDGSMNSDVNLTTGSIFSVLPRIHNIHPTFEQSFQQCGDNQIAAVYALYGAALKLVFTYGSGVFEFTYHQEKNEFYLSGDKITMPDRGFQYSCNEANSGQWTQKYRNYLDFIKNPARMPKYISRYLATVVGDVHRILHNGGIYIYPSTLVNKFGKIRLGYEANPLAFIVEQAGGKAFTDTGRILTRSLSNIHEQIPFFVGSAENMEDFLNIVNN